MKYGVKFVDVCMKYIVNHTQESKNIPARTRAIYVRYKLFNKVYVQQFLDPSAEEVEPRRSDREISRPIAPQLFCSVQH